MKPLWDVPVPQPFWPWARWRLAGGVGPRPAVVDVWLKQHKRKRIPADWHVHVKWIAYRRRPKPQPMPQVPPTRPPDFGYFGTGNGVLFTHPGGDAELAPLLKQSGFTWALWNVAPPYTLDDYETAFRQAEQHGIERGVWMHDRKPGDASRVEAITRERGFRIAGHNLEAEAQTGELTPPMLADELSRHDPSIYRLVPTLGWVQNSPDWEPLGTDLAHTVGNPECFLNFRPDLLPKVCCDHAEDLGFDSVLPLLAHGAFAEGPIAVPAREQLKLWPGVFAVYPGNGMWPPEWRR